MRYVMSLLLAVMLSTGLFWLMGSMVASANQISHDYVPPEKSEPVAHWVNTHLVEVDEPLVISCWPFNQENHFGPSNPDFKEIYLQTLELTNDIRSGIIKIEDPTFIRPVTLDNLLHEIRIEN